MITNLFYDKVLGSEELISNYQDYLISVLKKNMGTDNTKFILDITHFKLSCGNLNDTDLSISIKYLEYLIKSANSINAHFLNGNDFVASVSSKRTRLYICCIGIFNCVKYKEVLYPFNNGSQYGIKGSRVGDDVIPFDIIQNCPEYFKDIYLHELKCDDQAFYDICRGVKKFEYRRNDRGFNNGDMLLLKCIDKKGDFTGEEKTVEVTSILYGPTYGIPEGYCIMSLK